MIILGYNFNNEELEQLDVPGVYVYILRLSNYTYYTGITKDIRIRMLQHERGESKSTKYKRPLKLIYIVKFKDYKDAHWLEKKIKNRGAKQYLCRAPRKINKFDKSDIKI